MSDKNEPRPPPYGYRRTPQQQSDDPQDPPRQAPPGYEQGPYGYQQAPPPQKPRKRRRIFLWFFLAVQVIFLIWIIAGAQANHCNAQGSASANGACSAGTAIGVGLIIGLWVAADVILGISYIIFRLSTRNH
jgi:uncharacterized membrane protein YciS (DUF1049 family)